MGRVREGYVEHLIIWPFSYVATKIKYPHTALSLSQGKLSRRPGQELLRFAETFANKRIKTLSASQACGPGFVHSVPSDLEAVG